VLFRSGREDKNKACVFKMLNYICDMENIENYKSVLEYAKEKSISVQAVYQAISRKSLDFIKLGKTILVKVK
jgi:hypothetical protein